MKGIDHDPASWIACEFSGYSVSSDGVYGVERLVRFASAEREMHMSLRRRLVVLIAAATLAVAMVLVQGCSGDSEAAPDNREDVAAEPASTQEGDEMDFHLNYVEAGEGEPLILLHGNSENWTYFYSQIGYFQDQYRVIAVDTRGHGGSPRGTAPFTLDQFADDLAAFMDEQGIDEANILGFSDGANIALLFALDHPERVTRLVLNGANLSPEGLTEEISREIDEAYQAALAANDETSLEFLRLMVDEPHIDPSSLAALDMPVLVIAGTDDMIAEEHTRLIADSIPGAQLTFVPGTHFIAAENPGEFNAVVADFLKSMPGN